MPSKKDGSECLRMGSMGSECFRNTCRAEIEAEIWAGFKGKAEGVEGGQRWV